MAIWHAAWLVPYVATVYVSLAFSDAVRVDNLAVYFKYSSPPPTTPRVLTDSQCIVIRHSTAKTILVQSRFAETRFAETLTLTLKLNPNP